MYGYNRGAPAGKWAIDVRDESKGTLEIDIYDRIGESFFGDGVTAKDIRERLTSAKNIHLIKLRVNSSGGDVWDGFAIYNLLHEHRARVEADVDALAASAASTVIMAADEIRVAANAMIMIHNPWMITLGEARDHRSDADLLDKVRDSIVDAYAARTKVSRAELVRMMDEETWMGADEALELGFADVVRPVKARPEAYAALDLSHVRSAPEHLRRLVAQAQGRHAPPRHNDDEGPELRHARAVAAQMQRVAAMERQRHGESHAHFVQRVSAALRGPPEPPPNADLDLGDQVAARMLAARGRGDQGGDLIDRAAAALAARRRGEAPPPNASRARTTPPEHRADLVDRTAAAMLASRGRLDEAIELLGADEDAISDLVDAQLGGGLSTPPRTLGAASGGHSIPIPRR